MAPEPQIRVQMFGNFTIDACGQSVVFNEGRNSKNTLALQVLLYYFPNKISRDVLLDILCSNGESSDPSANLRVVFFRLKRFLQSTPLRDLFQICSNSDYRWLECSIPLSIDVLEFQQLYAEASQLDDPSQRLPLLLKAEQLYQNDFLQFSATNAWSQSVLASLQQKYLTCVENLIQIMSQKKQWSELYPIVLKACRLHPLEHFYCAGIDCLMGQNQYREAKQLYLKAVHVLRDELSVSPSSTLMKRAAQIDQLLLEGHETIHDLQQRLCETERIHGPYYCSPSSFVDVFRMVCRMAERSDSNTCLMLYSFTDFQGRSIHDASKTGAASECLRNSIQSCLRRGDAFTQYRQGQFIVLLTNTSPNGCAIVNKRIFAYYHTHAVRGIHLRCIQKNVNSSFFQV